MSLRRVIEHLRAQNWTAVALELVIVVLGVFLAFQLTAWSEDAADRRRSTQIIAALREDMRNSISVEGKAIAEIERGLAEFEAARARGERPRPYTFVLPGSFKAPNTIWDAALQSGLSEMVHPALMFDLAFYYSERDGIGDRYVRYAEFAEDEIEAREDDDPSVFYTPDGRLKPEYARNLRQLRGWSEFLKITLVSARCLERRFAHPTRTGISCHADYGPLYARQPDE